MLHSLWWAYGSTVLIWWTYAIWDKPRRSSGLKYPSHRHLIFDLNKPLRSFVAIDEKRSIFCWASIIKWFLPFLQSWQLNMVRLDSWHNYLKQDLLRSPLLKACALATNFITPKTVRLLLATVSCIIHWPTRYGLNNHFIAHCGMYHHSILIKICCLS